ncbi:MAG: hypothetical protein H7X94_12990 [Vallitaleaceae bacterium]|nr:hypothetical protein [Vallitaleaceae bacterium]
MIDFADNKYKDSWFRHPVIGEASFDTFKRSERNPVHKGKNPYEWTVNCSQFKDPVTGNLYAYVCQYPRGWVVV